MPKHLILYLDDALDHFSTKNNHVENFTDEEKENRLNEISADFRQTLEKFTEAEIIEEDE